MNKFVKILTDSSKSTFALVTMAYSHSSTIKMIKRICKFVSFFATEVHRGFPKKIRKIIAYLLILSLLYIGTHLILSRTSYYFFSDDSFDTETGYDYLPFHTVYIHSSVPLASLEIFLRVFFSPVAYLDYRITGIQHNNPPIMNLRG